MDKNDNSTAKKKFYSVQESRDAFMRVCATETDYKQIYASKVIAESSVAPYMSLIGTLKNPKAFMVDFENMSFKIFGFAKALDVCFKAFYVFNFAHPEACDAIWDFVNKLFYRLPGSDITKPATFVLLNDVKCKFSTIISVNCFYHLCKFTYEYFTVAQEESTTGN